MKSFFGHGLHGMFEGPEDDALTVEVPPRLNTEVLRSRRSGNRIRRLAAGFRRERASDNVEEMVRSRGHWLSGSRSVVP